MDVERYAGTVKMFTKFSSVNPGMTFDVYGSMNQNAVISSKNKEIM